jgi:hypothetical protein
VVWTLGLYANDYFVLPLSAGHGGPNAADYVRSNLFNNMIQSSKFPVDLQGAIGTGDMDMNSIISYDLVLQVPLTSPPGSQLTLTRTQMSNT